MADDDYEIKIKGGSIDLSDLGELLPGMAEIMPLVGGRIWKCYYAGKAKNRTLAAFQLKEAVNLMEKGAILRPEVRRGHGRVHLGHRSRSSRTSIEHRGLGRLRVRRSTRWSTRRTRTTRSTTRASCAGSCPTSRRPTSTSPPPDAAQVSEYSGPERRLGRGEAPALGGDGAALHAVRRLELDRRRARRRPPVADRVDLRGAHVRPQLGDVGAARVAAPAMWLGWSSRVLLPAANTDESLSKVSLPSGSGNSSPRSVRRSGCVVVGLGAAPCRRRCAPSRASSTPASAPPTKNPRPNTWRMSRTSWSSFQMKLSRTASSYVASAASGDVVAVAHRRERGLGREPSRLDRVVHALERRDVHHAGAVAAQQQARRVELLRECVEPAARDGLRAPLEPLAAVEDRPDLSGASSAPGAGRAPTARRRGSRGRRPCRSTPCRRPSGR